MKIKIKQHHILQGKRKSPMACPIALCLMENLKDVAEYVVVGYSDDTVSVRVNDRFQKLIPTDSKVFRHFIRAFDNDWDMSEFENYEISFTGNIETQRDALGRE